MELTVPTLAVTTRGLAGRSGGRLEGTRGALAWLAERGVAEVVLDATASDARPRNLDRAARRELAAGLKRRGQGAAGLDLLIPAEHFESGATAERAVSACVDAIGLAAELRAFGAAVAEPVVSVSMGSEPVGGALESIESAGERDGVRVAVLGGPDDARLITVELGPWARSGVDAAARIAEIGSRLAALRVDRFDRRTLTQVGACVGAMSVASPGAMGVADLTDSADPGRALEACIQVWRGPMGG